MPVTSPSTGAPFPTAQNILQRARAFANDAAQSLDGNLLSNNQPYTYELLNGGYDYVKSELALRGEPFPTKEIEIDALPVVDITLNTNPAAQVILDYNGFFDGVTQFDTPILPTDMMQPLRLWQRQTGVNASFVPMPKANDGLSSVAPVAYYPCWDWRTYQIYLNGALLENDLRIRYESFYPNFVKDDNDAQAAIFSSVNAIASAMVWIFSQSRGSTVAQGFKDNADMYISQIARRKNRLEQRNNHRRIPYSNTQRSRNRSY